MTVSSLVWVSKAWSRSSAKFLTLYTQLSSLRFAVGSLYFNLFSRSSFRLSVHQPGGESVLRGHLAGDVDQRGLPPGRGRVQGRPLLEHVSSVRHGNRGSRIHSLESAWNSKIRETRRQVGSK